MHCFTIVSFAVVFVAIAVTGEDVVVTNTGTNLGLKEASVAPSGSNNDVQDIKFCGKSVKSLRSQPVTYSQISGTWYALRIGPSVPGTENMEVECWTETYWRTNSTDQATISALVQMKMNGKWESCTSLGSYLTPLSEDGKGEINPHLRFVGDTPEKYQADCILEGTDQGKSWLVWNCCMEFVPGNKTSTWVLLGRLPYMDVKLEQDLIEEIEQASSFPGKALRGIKQLGCRD